MSENYKIKIGYSPVAGTRKAAVGRKDIWWWFALLAWVCFWSSGISIIGGFISNEIYVMYTRPRLEFWCRRDGSVWQCELAVALSAHFLAALERKPVISGGQP